MKDEVRSSFSRHPRTFAKTRYSLQIRALSRLADRLLHLSDFFAIFRGVMSVFAASSRYSN